MWYGIIMGLFLVVAIALVLVILMQQGKGAVMGASFGSGASNTVFGASGSGNFLTRVTTVLAVAFFGLALVIGVLTSGKSGTSGEDDIFAQEATDSQSAPAIATKDANSQSDIPSLPATGASSESDLPAVNTSQATTVEEAAAAKVETPAAAKVEPNAEQTTQQESAEDDSTKEEQNQKDQQN